MYGADVDVLRQAAQAHTPAYTGRDPGKSERCGKL